MNIAVNPAPNAAGWNRTDVTVAWNCDDAGSVQSSRSGARHVRHSSTSWRPASTAPDPAMTFGVRPEHLRPGSEGDLVADGTVELAVLCEDLDAPTGRFTHWVLSGIDPSATGVEEGEVPTGAVMGANGFGEIGWGGPQPPPGDGPHRYLFTVFASSAISCARR